MQMTESKESKTTLEPCFQHQAALRFHDVPFSSAIADEAACRIEGAQTKR
jgi:hypothetical protein